MDLLSWAAFGVPSTKGGPICYATVFIVSPNSSGSLGPGSRDKALAIVRDGNILASDRNGGVYTGLSTRHGSDDLQTVALTCNMPPDTELVTGFCAGDFGAIIPIRGAFDPGTDVQRVTVSVAGQPLDVELAFLGPLPP